MEEVKFVINSWYDDRDINNPYSFTLLVYDEYTGNAGDIIDEIKDVLTDFYLREKR